MYLKFWGNYKVNKFFKKWIFRFLQNIVLFQFIIIAFLYLYKYLSLFTIYLKKFTVPTIFIKYSFKKV